MAEIRINCTIHLIDGSNIRISEEFYKTLATAGKLPDRLWFRTESTSGTEYFIDSSKIAFIKRERELI